MDDKYLGKGIYSIAYASRLTRIHEKIHPAKINRWVKGYKGKNPILTVDYDPINGFYSLSFLDLIELFFINAFRKHGVSLKTIKNAYTKAQKLLQSNHPFSTFKFKTDGAKILAELGEVELMDLLTHQLVIMKIVDPFLIDVLEFDNDIVQRWWPLGKNKQVVLDPERNFGKPIVDREGVPVEVLGRAYKAEQSIESVASWFEVSNESVKDAVEYYYKLAA